MDKFGAIGDSETAQVEIADPAQRWPNLVGSFLGMQTINAGIGGATLNGDDGSPSVMAAVPAFLAPGLRIAALMLPVNDVNHDVFFNRPNSLAITRAVTAVDLFITQCLATGARPLIISPVLTKTLREAIRYPDVLYEVRRLCETRGQLYIPHWEAMVQDSASMTAAVFDQYYLPGDYHEGVVGADRTAAIVGRNILVGNNAAPPPPGPPTGSTILNASITSIFGHIAGRVVRMVYGLPLLSNIPTGPVSEIRFWLRGYVGASGIPAEPLRMDKLFVGEQSSGPNAASWAPVHAGSPIDIDAGILIDTGWTPFAWSKQNAIMLSARCLAGEPRNSLAGNEGVGNAVTYLLDGGVAPDQMGVSVPANLTFNYLSLVEKIEVR